MMDHWVETTFTIQTGQGPKIVNGFQSGFFALDQREYETSPYAKPRKGWVLTHLPTGHAIRGIRAQLATAKRFAAAVAECADWDFTDVKDAPQRGPAARIVFDRFPQVSAAGAFRNPVAEAA